MKNSVVKNLKTFIASRLRRRAIGIDIDQNRIHAVQMVYDGQAYRIEKSFSSYLRRKDDTPERMLATLFKKHQFSRHAPVASALRPEKVYMRCIPTDEEESTPARLTGHFPIPSDCIAVSTLKTSKQEDSCNTLAMACSAEEITRMLGILRDAGVRTPQIRTPMAAMLSAVLFSYPEASKEPFVLTFVTDKQICLAVVVSGKIRFARQVPHAKATLDDYECLAVPQIQYEASLAWGKVFNGPLPLETNIYLADQRISPDGLQERLNETCPESCIVPIVFDRFAHQPGNSSQEGEYMAQALAFSAIDRAEDIDWIELGGSRLQKNFDIKRELLWVGSLAAAVAIVAVAGMFLRVSSLESQYARINDKIESVFTKALPDEPKMVKPLAQLNQRLAEVDRGFSIFDFASDGNADFISAFHDVFSTIPVNSGIIIESFQAEERIMVVKGRARAFESIRSWQSNLSETNASLRVETHDLNKLGNNGKISFTLSISIGEVYQYASITQ